MRTSGARRGGNPRRAIRLSTTVERALRSWLPCHEAGDSWGRAFARAKKSPA